MLHITYDCNNRRRVIEDDMNPRMRAEEWMCEGCMQWVDHELVLWCLPDGTLSTDKGAPYCQGCAPEQPDERM